MDASTRVVITGLGTISSNGHDLDDFWTWVSSAPPQPVVSEIHGFDPSPWLSSKEIKRFDYFTHLGVSAAHLALDDAGLDPSTIAPRRGGVVMGTLFGATRSMEEQVLAFDPADADQVPPFFGMAACENLVAAMTSQHAGWRGPSKVVVTACASGTHAVAEGADLIRSGRCDAVLAGGAQGRALRPIVASFDNIRLLSASSYVRPFDKRRDGFVYTEGAAVLVLERLDRALERGARIYGEVWGSAHTNDADSLISPSGSGAAECIEDALIDAGCEPGDIVHVNAHGTGTGLNDLKEAEALHAIFGATPPPVTSVKRVLGHATGAAGAFEAAAVALTVHHGLMPSLGTDVEPDESLDLDLVTGPPRPMDPGPVLSNSFGIGGHNGCLVIGPIRS